MKRQPVRSEKEATRGKRVAFRLPGLCHRSKNGFVAPAINLPRINNKGIRDGSIIIGPDRAEQVAIRIEVQDAGVWKTASGGNAILDCRDRATRTPDVIHNQGGAAAQFVVGGELDERGPRHQLGFRRLGWKVHRGGKDVCDVHGIRQQSTRDNTAARDHDHGRKLAAELGQEVIYQTIHLLPGYHFTTLFGLHALNLIQHRGQRRGRGDLNRLALETRFLDLTRPQEETGVVGGHSI